MTATRAFNITLPVEIADMMQAKISAGEYANESEVVRDGLLTLVQNNIAIERWLLDDVLPAIEELDRDAGQVRTVAEKRDELNRYMHAVETGNSTKI